MPETKRLPVASGRRMPRVVKPSTPLARSPRISPRMAIFGFMDGQITIRGDFDETPEEIVDLMTNGPL